MSVDVATRVMRADAAAAAAAARALAEGGLVAFPTETVYGLGADAANARAVARLFAAKDRPSFNPLISHVADLAQARRLARFDPAAARLAAAFWPGPLTLVLPKTNDCPVSELATAGLDTIAVRMPDHPVAREILAAFAGPVVAPSANRSGRLSPTSAAHVLADLEGRIDLLIDGGLTQVGIESTVVACLDATAFLLRPGGLPRSSSHTCARSTPRALRPSPRCRFLTRTSARRSTIASPARRLPGSRSQRSEVSNQNGVTGPIQPQGLDQVCCRWLRTNF